MPGLSGFRRGLVSTCSGTSLQPIRGISSQRLSTARARCSSVCFFSPVVEMLKIFWTQSGFTCYRYCIKAHEQKCKITKLNSYQMLHTIFILNLGGSCVNSVGHLHSSSRPVLGLIHFAVFAEFGKDLCRFQGVSPHVISITKQNSRTYLTSKHHWRVFNVCDIVRIYLRSWQDLLTLHSWSWGNMLPGVYCSNGFPNRSSSPQSDHRFPPNPSHRWTRWGWSPSEGLLQYQKIWRFEVKEFILIEYLSH